MTLVRSFVQVKNLGPGSCKSRYMALAELQAFPKQAARRCGIVTAISYATVLDSNRNPVDECKVTETKLSTFSAQIHVFDSESTTKSYFKLAADPELKQWIAMLEVSSMNDKETRAGLLVDNRKNTTPENFNSRSSYNRRQGETVLAEEERESRLRPNTDFRAAESNKLLEMLLESICD